MEFRLFHRPKDFRFIRPHRVAFLEWVRTLRHNIFCEITLLADRLRHYLKTKHFVSAVTRFSPSELFPQPLRAHWPMRLREIINGRRAAEAVIAGYELLRTRGIHRVFWPLLFMLGVTLGFGAKWWAEDHLTIGYDDYRLTAPEMLYDLNALKEKVQMEQGTIVENEKKIYPACNLE